MVVLGTINPGVPGPALLLLSLVILDVSKVSDVLFNTSLMGELTGDAERDVHGGDERGDDKAGDGDF